MIVLPLFAAVYVASNKGKTFYIDFSLHEQGYILGPTNNRKFKYFSRSQSAFPAHMTDFTLDNFSSKTSLYFQVFFKPENWSCFPITGRAMVNPKSISYR